MTNFKELIPKNRLIILEEDGSWKEYEKEKEIGHQIRLNEYCEEKNIPINLIREKVVELTKSFIIYNMSDDVILTYLPSKLSNDQLYQLELFTDLSLENVQYIEVKKLTEPPQFFTYATEDGEDIADCFRNEVIQSYYEKDSSKQR